MKLRGKDNNVYNRRKTTSERAQAMVRKDPHYLGTLLYLCSLMREHKFVAQNDRKHIKNTLQQYQGFRS